MQENRKLERISFFSKVGKLILIKAILVSLPIHVTGIIPNPECDCNQMVNYAKKHWWGMGKSKTKIPWVSLVLENNKETLESGIFNYSTKFFLINKVGS